MPNSMRDIGNVTETITVCINDAYYVSSTALLTSHILSDFIISSHKSLFFNVFIGV